MDFYAFQSSELTSNQLTIKEKDLSEVSGNVFIIQFLNLVFFSPNCGFPCNSNCYCLGGQFYCVSSPGPTVESSD